MRGGWLFQALVCLTLLLSASQRLLAEEAEEVDGAWEFADQGTVKVLGIVVPEYAQDEFVIFFLTCDLGRPGTVDLIVNLFLQEEPSTEASAVTMTFDGEPALLPLAPEFDEMNGGWYLLGELPVSHPAIGKLGAAKEVILAAEDATLRLPDAKRMESFRTFAGACGF